MKRPHETPEERESAQIARFSQYVLSPEAWFRVADELEAAMKLLEPQIERFWECFRADAGVVEKKDSEPPPKHSLINVHMMLAGFAIENLCKGHLGGRLTWKERKKVKGGELPKCLDGHKILKLVRRTGMTLAEFERDLLARITEVISWRGRYPAHFAKTTLTRPSERFLKTSPRDFKAISGAIPGGFVQVGQNLSAGFLNSGTTDSFTRRLFVVGDIQRHIDIDLGLADAMVAGYADQVGYYVLFRRVVTFGTRPSAVIGYGFHLLCYEIQA
jgi:hypothetical protein